MINFVCADETYPVVTCPTPRVEYITYEGEQRTMNILQSEFTYSDDVYVYSFDYSPKSIEVSNNTLDQAFQVSATVVDSSGNKAYCQSQIVVKSEYAQTKHIES